MEQTAKHHGDPSDDPIKLIYIDCGCEFYQLAGSDREMTECPVCSGRAKTSGGPPGPDASIGLAPHPIEKGAFPNGYFRLPEIALPDEPPPLPEIELPDDSPARKPTPGTPRGHFPSRAVRNGRPNVGVRDLPHGDLLDALRDLGFEIVRHPRLSGLWLAPDD